MNQADIRTQSQTNLNVNGSTAPMVATPARRSDTPDKVSGSRLAPAPSNWDFRVHGDGRLQDVSALSAHKLTAQYPRLIVLEGRLQPLNRHRREHWFDSLRLALSENKARLSCVACEPDNVHAFLEPDPAGELILVTLESENLCSREVFDVYALHYRLTPAEQNVLWKLSLGMTTRSVGNAIGITENTMRAHVRSVLSKTGEPSTRHILVRLGRISQMGGGVFRPPTL